MPETDSIEVAPSADNGNVPAEAPSEPIVETAAPAVPTETESASAAPELYELPDGRKVDGATVASEYKNLLSDYTRKSQALAAKDSAPLQDPKPANPLADPNYVPQTYDELAAQIEARTLNTLQAKEQARIDSAKALETTVATELSEVKAIDPTVNENLLFAHATKYKFTDLKTAHQNMKDMNEAMKKVQQTTVANVQKRNDPVSVSHGASGAKLNPAQYGSAVEYLRALKGSQ